MHTPVVNTTRHGLSVLLLFIQDVMLPLSGSARARQRRLLIYDAVLEDISLGYHSTACLTSRQTAFRLPTSLKGFGDISGGSDVGGGR